MSEHIASAVCEYLQSRGVCCRFTQRSNTSWLHRDDAGETYRIYLHCTSRNGGRWNIPILIDDEKLTLAPFPGIPNADQHGNMPDFMLSNPRCLPDLYQCILDKSRLSNITCCETPHECSESACDE